MQIHRGRWVDVKADARQQREQPDRSRGVGKSGERGISSGTKRLRARHPPCAPERHVRIRLHTTTRPAVGPGATGWRAGRGFIAWSCAQARAFPRRRRSRGTELAITQDAGQQERCLPGKPGGKSNSPATPERGPGEAGTGRKTRCGPRSDPEGPAVVPGRSLRGGSCQLASSGLQHDLRTPVAPRIEHPVGLPARRERETMRDHFRDPRAPGPHDRQE